MTYLTSVVSRYAAFLVDVDGVLTHGTDPVPGAATALAVLQGIGRTLVLTNNSTRSRSELAHHLTSSGFDVDAADVVGSAFLAAQYLVRHTGPSTVWVLGEDGIRREMEEAGHRLARRPEEANWIVVGMDRELTYAKLTLALRALDAGARVLATNEDATFPTPTGPVPGAGALVGALRGMGFPPARVVGKPSSLAFEAALDILGAPANRVLMIGDRLETDIVGAAVCGLDSALVLTGVCSHADLVEGTTGPTWVAGSLAELCAGRILGGLGLAG